MKKLALAPENLQVQSFDTTTGRVGTGGTVIGNSEYDTSVETCNGSCFPCDYTPACNTDQRGPC